MPKSSIAVLLNGKTVSSTGLGLGRITYHPFLDEYEFSDGSIAKQERMSVNSPKIWRFIMNPVKMHEDKE